MSGLTRRRLLRLASAAGFLSACQPAAPAPRATVQVSATSRSPAPTNTPAATASPAAERASLDADVLIVGAGLAGLAAARTLRAAGVSVVVLEGRGRPGGRVFTDTSTAIPLDLGGAFARNQPGDPILRVATAFGAITSSVDRTALAVFAREKQALAAAELAQLDSASQAVRSAVRAARSRAGTGGSLQEVVPAVARALSLKEPLASALQAALASEYVIGTGEDLDKVSLGAQRLLEAAPNEVVFPRGAGEWVLRAAVGMPIRYGWRITRLMWDANGVYSGSDRRTIAARKAIITVPLGLLQNRRLEFSPDLPEAMWQSLRALRMASLARIGLVFPEQFWDKNSQVIQVARAGQEDFVDYLDFSRHTGQPVLMATAGGRYARALESYAYPELMDHVMRDLRFAFGSRIPEPESALITRWDSDPFTFGSISLRQPGSSAADNLRCAQPVGSTLFFAGEHTDATAPGTMHGAWWSGERAANEVLAALAH